MEQDSNSVNSSTSSSNDFIFIETKQKEINNQQEPPPVVEKENEIASKTSLQAAAHLSTVSQNSVLFYGITYLGCASVNAPKSEIEINRIIQTLNQHDKATIDIIMSVPNTINENIQLFDALNEFEIATYKMSQVLFVVRGQRGSTEESCFAFTTCHGDNLDNLIFPCHVFRCKLADAVSKILYSFWTVFKRQQMLIQKSKSIESEISNDEKQHSSSSSGKSLSTVASSLFSSLYGGASIPSNIQQQQHLTQSSTNSLPQQQQQSQQLAEQAVKFANGSIQDQFIFRTLLEIKEEQSVTSSSGGVQDINSYVNVPKDKEFFKLRKNLDKILSIQIQQISNKPLEIQRCFGVLLCAGRNCNVNDMQLLETISMGKSTTDSKSYLISAYWNPREPSFQILNEETQKNMRVFLTIALDLVIDTIQEPIRFCIETKARIYSQTEKFWVYQKTKFTENFYVQLRLISKHEEEKTTNEAIDYHLDSIHSETELKRKLAAQEKQLQQFEQQVQDHQNDEADAEDIVFSGFGDVNKDLGSDELADWTELLMRWRKNFNEKPRDLAQLIRRNGVPETLRGEVWQLLAGCIENEKAMHESYRLLLSKESSCEQVILRDINRTFPGHQYFQDENGQQALYKLSKAYSIYDIEIGYCQGLSFLIATLLLHMPEEQTFNLLVKIMYGYQIREIYKTNFELLHLRFYQLELLIQEYLPELFEHFTDLNIETHMYASQWFLTLYTAKFPLYMVYRIIDLFLNDGLIVLFTIGLALLKASQRELLSLDFEGILKYFRVQMPKKYRQEANFKELMTIWMQLSVKLKEKKLNKLEKQYLLIQKSKEDPVIKLTQQVRRLEQENDDLANEFIDTRISLNKQIEELRDVNETLKNEQKKSQFDVKVKLVDSEETNKKLQQELESLKQLWRSQTDKYEYEIERQHTIINEYKQICNKLSTKIEVNENLIKLFDLFLNKYKNEETVENVNLLNDDFIKTISTIIETNRLMQNDEHNVEDVMNTLQPLFNKNKDFDSNELNLIKIKQLELELARVKLELVDSQCKNQEYKHKINKQQQQSQSGSNNSIVDSTSSNGDQVILSSTKTTKNNQSGQNNWLSKTFTQFKEATNQVVQKVKTNNGEN